MPPIPADANPRAELLATLRRGARHLPAILGVLLLIGAIFVVQREFRHLNLRDVGRAMRSIPARALLIAAVWNLLAYGVLTFYDRLATIYAGKRVSFGRTALASFCAYALAHNLGFAAVSGAAVRYRLYSHWGLTPEQIAKVIAFCSLTFGLGGMSLGGAILFGEPHAVPWFGEHSAAVVCSIPPAPALWLVVGTYVFISTRYPVLHFRGRTIELPGWRMALMQVALATVDVAVTASIFYALLPAGPRPDLAALPGGLSRQLRGSGWSPTCRADSACSMPPSCSACRAICRRRSCSAPPSSSASITT